MWRTQIGGKYHPDDDTVFRVKRLLTRLGIDVSHPIADEIKSTTAGHGYAFDLAQMSFNDVERHYYESIRASDFHIVANQFQKHLGYLGASASLEIAYAMCHHRRVMLLHRPAIQAGVDPVIRAFLRPRLHKTVVHNILTASDEQNITALSRLARRSVSYNVTDDDRQLIEIRVRALLDKLRAEAGHAAS